MDIATVSEWLKNTIPGIILLGVIGGLLSAIIIWAFNRVFVPVVNQSLVAALKKLLMHFVGPATKQLVRLHFVTGDNKTHVFYTLQVMKLSVFLFVATCGFVLFALAISQDGQVLFRSPVLAPLVVSFLATWHALRCVAVALIPLYVDIDTLITEAKDEVIKEIGAKDS
ncbi:hypothetical protein [Methylomonas sp. YC3]